MRETRTPFPVLRRFESQLKIELTKPGNGKLFCQAGAPVAGERIASVGRLGLRDRPFSETKVLFSGMNVVLGAGLGASSVSSFLVPLAVK